MQVLTIPVTPFMQNCRVLVCPQSKAAAIVDPGGEPEKIIARLTAEGLEPTMILLTHAHLDHVGASTALGEHFGIEIIGPHEGDRFWLEALPMQSQMFGFANHASFLPSKWLNDGDNVKVGHLDLEVRHCPGHTPGHVVFYEPVSQQVIVGDVLFKGSVGRTDFPKGDAAQLKQSIENKLFTLPDEVIVHSGHGENTSIGFEKATNPFMSGRFG
ncbi:MBL fold metallo-hydrolase [Pseudoalteromonas piscicida]|uniref:MBL fold metallo-hydrolase n=1 Tax=Pseudoalteromonas piscicida TaxID=43662 RepID=A0A2A5JM32_PSEO7|nr:MBL fold metallo-hydrolase [Pseudoalteromonas piscicida]PCK30514.1 MBL fold metallo-hydrolase [Pseudoalteromonas piscicida]